MLALLLQRCHACVGQSAPRGPRPDLTINAHRLPSARLTRGQREHPHPSAVQPVPRSLARWCRPRRRSAGRAVPRCSALSVGLRVANIEIGFGPIVVAFSCPLWVALCLYPALRSRNVGAACRPVGSLGRSQLKVLALSINHVNYLFFSFSGPVHGRPWFLSQSSALGPCSGPYGHGGTRRVRCADR